jgi:hypothetical protein
MGGYHWVGFVEHREEKAEKKMVRWADEDKESADNARCNVSWRENIFPKENTEAESELIEKCPFDSRLDRLHFTYKQ